MKYFKYNFTIKEMRLRKNKLKKYMKMLDKLKKKKKEDKTYLVNNNIYYLEKKIERINKQII